MKLQQTLAGIVSAAAVVLLSACATTVVEPDVDMVQAAETAIAKAEAVRAAELAPLPLRDAREKLLLARQELEKTGSDNNEHARRLLEQSRVDAEAAAAMAQSARMQANNDELNRNILMLKQATQPTQRN